MKDRFKYEVDRSSPTNKLREFLVWSKDIMEDIKYQKRILSVPLFRFFVKGWYVLCASLTLLLATIKKKPCPTLIHTTTSAYSPLPASPLPPPSLSLLQPPPVQLPLPQLRPLSMAAHSLSLLIMVSNCGY